MNGENYVARIIPQLQIWWDTIIILIYIIGLALVIVSAFQAVSHKHKYNKSLPVWTFFSAVLLLNFPTFLDSVSMTFFNQSSEHTLSYMPPSSKHSIYIQFGIYGIMLIGLIGFARGLCLMRDNSKTGNFSRAIIHFVGGTFAINIVQFLHVIGATLGGGVQSYISKIIG